MARVFNRSGAIRAVALDISKAFGRVWRASLLHKLKDTLSGLRQFLAIENPLKMIKNAIYFTSKAFFVLKIFG